MRSFISIFMFGLLFALSVSATPPPHACIEQAQTDIGAPPQSVANAKTVIPGTNAKTVIPGTNAETQSSSAEVRQVNGLYIFLYSTPSDETEFLGAVISPPIVLSTDMDKMVQMMSRRAHEKYPEAEAIIFSNNDLSRCDAVKFRQ